MAKELKDSGRRVQTNVFEYLLDERRLLEMKQVENQDLINKG